MLRMASLSVFFIILLLIKSVASEYISPDHTSGPLRDNVDYEDIFSTVINDSFDSETFYNTKLLPFNVFFSQEKVVRPNCKYYFVRFDFVLNITIQNIAEQICFKIPHELFNISREFWNSTKNFIRDSGDEFRERLNKSNHCKVWLQNETVKVNMDDFKYNSCDCIYSVGMDSTDDLARNCLLNG